MDALKELKWFILVLVAMWVVWFFTGGPTRFASKAGPFLRPPAPISTGEIYGKDISTKIEVNVNLSSGIEGIVISKKCGPVQQGIRCNDARPMNLRIAKKSGEVVQDVRLAKDGNFKVPLPAGEYIISQKSYYTDVPPYQHPIVVKVRSFNYSKIGIVFDNSIR